MRVMRRAEARAALLALFIVAVAMLGAACAGLSARNSADSAPATVSLPPAADADTIAANFVMFFDGARPVAERIGLLEDGQHYEAQLETMAASALGKTVSVAISVIASTSAATAEVKFSILVGGEPAVPDHAGKAVLQDGQWKVAAETFLAVLAQVGASSPDRGDDAEAGM
jgi:hypothetical protein